MVAKHSPLPWRVFDEAVPTHHCPGIDAPGFSVVVWGNEGEQQGVQGHTAEEARANAEFIVRCVNSHEALIDALRTIEALICDKPLCGHFTAEEIRDVVHAAIAQAEGSH